MAYWKAGAQAQPTPRFDRTARIGSEFAPGQRDPLRLPSSSPPWYLHPLHWWQRRRYGVVLEPTALWSHRPLAMLGFVGLFAALRRRESPLPLDLRTLVGLRVSQLCSCAFCIDMNASLLEKAGASPGKALALAHWRDDPAFSATERLALEYAEAMTRTPPAIDDELFGRIRAAFPPEAIVELTAVAAMQNLSARFNAALDVGAHGFCALGAGPARPPRAATTVVGEPTSAGHRPADPSPP